MHYLKRHSSIILILLLALLAIALVLWVFNKKLRLIDAKIQPTALNQSSEALVTKPVFYSF